MRFLTCVGDATSVGTHGGLPYHLLHAGLQAGFLDGGWSLQPQKLRVRRILWNAGRLLTCGEYGGYQYASSFLRALIRQEPRASSIHDEVISIFPLLPPDCPRRAGVSFYIDATLQQNFEDYGITRSVGRAMITEALARERQAYRDATRILCRSRAAASSVVGAYGIEPNKVHVVPGGANIIGDPGPSRYGPDNLPLAPVRLGFVGKDWQRKNLPFVLKIADVLKTRGIAVEVIAAGFSAEHGPRHPLLRSIGFIDKRHALNAFVDLLRSCHFTCLFSFAEAFGLSNRESLRLGVPVLASNVGGIPDTVPAGCGHLFAPDADAADVADIIEGYARDAGRYWQLRDAVGRRTREFTWVATVERMQHIWAGSTAYRFRDEERAMLDRPALRVAVLQPGARLHYAVPTLLQRAGMLQRLYTDFANIGSVRHIESLWPRCLQPAAVRRLFGRKLPSEIPPSKVQQVRYAVMRERLMSSQSAREDTSSRALMKRALGERFGGANAIYTVLVNEDLDLCRTAKAQGCRIIHEVMLTPDVGLLTESEYRRHAISQRAPSLREIEAGRERDRQKYALADLILVPSEFVRESVLALGADPAIVALVPYGIDRSWLQRPSHPVPGRILFVGSVGLRKGSHHLAGAARRLAERNVECEVRVAGPLEVGAAQSALFAGPKYLGQVPRMDIHREYSHADIFVLPSLAEGMAVVTLEAMAVGLPVITTPNAGSCVRNGIDGIIVPAGDVSALATAIERLISDRGLRETMSQNAKARAAQFTWEKYEGRLIGTLSRLEALLAASAFEQL